MATWSPATPPVAQQPHLGSGRSSFQQVGTLLGVVVWAASALSFAPTYPDSALSQGGAALPARAAAGGSCRRRAPRCTAVVAAAAGAPPKRRVVVTGLGCVTSLGHDKNVFYQCVCDTLPSCELVC